MALQDVCDTCGSDVNAESLIFVKRLGFNMCAMCINELINDLADGYTLEECGA